jgi:hypothetical protein
MIDDTIDSIYTHGDVIYTRDSGSVLNNMNNDIMNLNFNTKIIAFLMSPNDNNTAAFCTTYNNFLQYYYNSGNTISAGLALEPTENIINHLVNANTIATGGLATIPLPGVSFKLSYHLAAEYQDRKITEPQILCRTYHDIYNKSETYHIPAFSKKFDAIQPNKIVKGDNVKISCTRGTRGYSLQLLKNNGSPIFSDLEYNYEYLKINDKNARSINGFISVDGLNEFTELNENSDNVKIKLLSLLDSIISHTYSILGCADEVLKELGDTPVYFETYEGSVEAYQLRNNNDQLMPLSLSLWFMNDNYSLAQSNDIGPSHVLFGGHNLGSSNFKLLYGTRQLLARDMALTYEDVPWVKTLLNRHNSSSSDKQVEESRYLQFVNRLMSGLRFVVNSHGYKRIVAYNTSGVDMHNEYFGNHDCDIWIMDRGGNNGHQFVKKITTIAERDKDISLWYGNTIELKNTVYALANGRFKSDLVIQLLEDSFQENSVSKMLMAFYLDESKPNSISRKDERIKVIIDSSINPINIHALMQDIPLANVYNYEYTFETMAASMYGLLMKHISESDDTNMEKKHPLKQTIIEFLRLLRNPFASVNPNTFHIGFNMEEPLFNIFTGDGSLGMGRPKFLSDQLFNKCLLNNVYYDNSRPKTRGPALRSARNDQDGININNITAYFRANNFQNHISNTINRLINSNIVNTWSTTIYQKSLEYRQYSSGDPTNPEKYPSKDNSQILFRFLMNAEDPDNNTKTKSIEMLRLGIGGAATEDNQIYVTAINRNLRVVAATHPRFRNNAGTGNELCIQAFKVISQPKLAARFRELYKKTNFYSKFMSIVNTPEIRTQFIYNISKNAKFIKFARLEETFKKIMDGIFEITFLESVIAGGRPNWTDTTIGNPAVQNNWYGYFIAPAGFHINSTTNGDFLTDTLVYGLYCDFSRVFGAVNNTPLYKKAEEFNKMNTNISNNINNFDYYVDLIMSYLKEYNYKGKFDGYTDDNKNNPLVTFIYSRGNANPRSTNGTTTLRETIRNIGYLRFNTNIIRNLFFISNILRIIRLQINREFTQNRSILKSSHFAISPSVTEYGIMDPNESFHSSYRGASTFNDTLENSAEMGEGDMEEIE